MEDMKKILLTKGKFALVDDSDFVLRNQRKWLFSKGGYAVSRSDAKVYMHAFINKTSKGFHTDHINRNKLDNRRKNLRTVTASQNLLNSKTYKNNKSGYRGIYWYERYKKWEVHINRIYVGRFKRLREAIQSRKKFEKQFI